MTATVKVKNLATVMAQIKNREGNIEAAGEAGVNAVALAVYQETQRLLTLNSRTYDATTGRLVPPRHIGGPGSPPNRVSGNLVQSMRINTRKGFGTYSADVFPTMEYARQLETGEGSMRGVKYPYLTPAANLVQRTASRIFTAAFVQRWKG
jgi:hypothetical protein